MSSLYDDLFEEDGKNNKPKPNKPQPSPIDDDKFQASTTESLDEILALTKRFNLKAEPFSQLLTKTRAIDHEVEKGVLDFFLVAKDPHDQGVQALAHRDAGHFEEHGDRGSPHIRPGH